MTMAQMIRATSSASTLCALTHRAFDQLADEQGSPERAMRWLVRQANRSQSPICVNLPTGPAGDSRTIVIPPKGWPEGRVLGYVGARHEELEATFGRAERVYMPDQATPSSKS